MSRRMMLIVSALVIVGLFGAGGIALWQWRATSGPECTVPRPAVETDDTGAANDTADRPLSLTAVQLQHAATINAVGIARHEPYRARVIALATAWQESSLRNINYGDRDSLGLFQQRPSQGWGEPQELMDPIFAATAFYEGLTKVAGWQDMSITEAAQAVQRSGHPDAYAKWEPDAHALAFALGGAEPLALSCRRGAIAPTAVAPLRPLPPQAAMSSPGLQELLAAAVAEFAPGDVIVATADDHTAVVAAQLPGLDHAESARVLAAWMVAHATGFDVRSVAVGAHRWSGHRWSDVEPLADGDVTVTVAG